MTEFCEKVVGFDSIPRIGDLVTEFCRKRWAGHTRENGTIVRERLYLLLSTYQTMLLSPRSLPMI